MSIPGIQVVQGGWGKPSVGLLSRTSTIKVPVKVTFADGKENTISLTFSGTKEELENLDNNPDFLREVKLAAAAALKSGILTPTTTSNAFAPTTFTAKLLSQGFELKRLDGADMSDIPGTKEDKEKALKYINSKRKYLKHHQGFDYAKNFLLGTRPSGEPDHGNNFYALPGEVQEIVKAIVNKAEKGTEFPGFITKVALLWKMKCNLSQYNPTLGSMRLHAFSGTIGTEATALSSSAQNVMATLEAFEKMDGTRYDKRPIPPNPQHNNLKKPNLAPGTILNTHGTTLKESSDHLDNTSDNLLRTRDKNQQQYIDNLHDLAGQYDVHAEACRKLADAAGKSPFMPENALQGGLEQQAAEAASMAYDLRRAAKQQLESLATSMKAQAFAQGKPPYDKPATLEQAQLNARVLLDEKFPGAPSPAELQGVWNYYAVIKNDSKSVETTPQQHEQLKTQQTPGSPPPPPPQIPLPQIPSVQATRDLKNKVDNHAKELNKALQYLQSKDCSTQERELIKNIKEKLKIMTAASLELEEIAVYGNLRDASKAARIKNCDAAIQQEYKKIEEDPPLHRLAQLPALPQPPASPQPIPLQAISGHAAALQKLFQSSSALVSHTDEQRYQIATQQKEILKRFDILIAAADPDKTPPTISAAEQQKVRDTQQSLKDQKSDLEAKYKAFLGTFSSDLFNKAVVQAQAAQAAAQAQHAAAQATQAQANFQAASLSSSAAAEAKKEWVEARKEALNKLPGRTEAELNRKVALLVECDLNAGQPSTLPTPDSGKTPDENNRIQIAHLNATFRLENSIRPWELAAVMRNLGLAITLAPTDQPQGFQLPPQAIVPTSKQHTANLLALAAILDEVGNIPSNAAAFFAQRDNLRAAATTYLDAVDKASAAAATASLSSENSKLPFRIPQGYREVVANADFASVAWPTPTPPAPPYAGASEIQAAYNGTAPTNALPPKEIIDKLVQLQQNSLEQLRSLRPFCTGKELKEVDKKIVALQSKLEGTMTASLQLEYLEEAKNKTTVKEKTKLKSDYDNKIREASEQLNEAATEKTNSSRFPKVVPGDFQSLMNAAAFAQTVRTKPADRDEERIAIANYQKKVLNALNALPPSSLSNAEQQELLQQKLKLVTQYKAHLGTLRTPPKNPTIIADWEGARRDALSIRPEAALQTEFNITLSYYRDGVIPPLKGPSPLVLNPNPTIRKQQLDEMKADLEAKHQFLGPITDISGNQTYTNCVAELKKQYEALSNACSTFQQQDAELANVLKWVTQQLSLSTLWSQPPPPPKQGMPGGVPHPAPQPPPPSAIATAAALQQPPPSVSSNPSGPVVAAAAAAATTAPQQRLPIDPTTAEMKRVVLNVYNRLNQNIVEKNRSITKAELDSSIKEILENESKNPSNDKEALKAKFIALFTVPKDKNEVKLALDRVK